MKILKKILSLITIIFLMNAILTDCSKKAISTASAETRPVKVSVFIWDFNDTYLSLVHKNLEDIQKENPGKVEYTFYDGKRSEDIQNEELDKVLKEGTDLILLNIVNRGDAKTVIYRIKNTIFQ